MKMPDQKRSRGAANWVSLGASVFAVTVGGIALIGWALDIVMLKSVLPGFVTMKPNTAICFMLAGVALYLSCSVAPRPWSVTVARACAAVVVAIASLSFAENVLALDFGIDQALFRDVRPAGDLAPPGRMTYTTAFSFMMIGLALLLSRGRHRTLITAQLAALLSGLTGLLAVISYIYGVQQDFTFGSNTAMALHTAVTFLVITAGVLAMSPGYGLIANFTSDRIGCVVARRLLAIGIGLSIVLGWLHLEGEKRALYGHELGAALLVSSTIATLTAAGTWVAISMNRTDEKRKLAEEELRHQADLLELAHDAIIVQDCDSRIIYWNHGAEETYGWKQEEALGKVARDLLKTRFPKPLEELKLEAGEKGLWEGELQQATRAGAKITVSSRWAVETDDGGDISGYLEINRDVTERNRAEQELKQIEWLFTRKPEAKSYEPAYGNLTELNKSRLILDSVGEELLSSIMRDYLDLMETSSAVYERNGDYAVGIFSSGWCRYMDLASREMCHTSDNREALDSGNWGCHESCWTDASKAAIETGEPVDTECFGGISLFAMPIFADEEIVGAINFGYGDPPKDPHALQEIAGKCNADYEELAALSESYNTRPPYIVDLAKDRLRATAMLIGEIVERKQADAKVERLNEDLRSYAGLLEDANKELEAFSYSVSHDLRAPLRAIDGFSKLLMEDYSDKLNDEGRRFIGIVRENTQKMADLIDDILALSRLGRKEIELSDIDMGAMARKVFKELRLATDSRVIDFQVREIPHAFGDSTLMYQVLTNLLSNAIKFTGPREKTVIELGGRYENGHNVYYVKDNGVGFDMKYADKLFGVFQRLHSAEEFEGTGAGLSIVQRAVHRQGGSVWAESEIGKGSTFYFALPANLESSTEGRSDE